MWPFSKKKEYILTPTHELLLALLRAQLWLKPVDDIALPGCGHCFLNNEAVKPLEPLNESEIHQQWDDLLNLAYKQTVVCFIAAACLRHKDVDSIPQDIREELEAVIEENKKIHEYHNEVLVELITKFEEQGFHPILLKGQGIAMMYPQPELRQCGDIDLYFCPEEYTKAIAAFSEFEEDLEKKSDETVHHYHSSYKGIEVDLHRKLGRLQNPFQDMSFQKWTKQYYVNQYVRTTIIIAEKDILVPSPQANAMELFRHLYGHFITRGIGFRQLIDFVMFLRFYHSEIDENVIAHDLKCIGELKAWQIFSYICVEYLHLPIDCCPYYTDKYKIVASYYYGKIVYEGNFGRDIFYKKGVLLSQSWSAKYRIGMLIRKIQNDVSWFWYDCNNSICMLLRDIF